MPRRQKSLDLNTALKLLRQNGSRLVLTNTERGQEFFIVLTGGPGGPVTEKTAKRIQGFRACRPLDSGLLPGLAQSWTLDF